MHAPAILKKTAVLAALLTCGAICSAAGGPSDPQLIWDNGTYNAFPSIVEFGGRYFISFREGQSHIFNDNGIADGKARILVSRNGRRWDSVALLSKEGFDLRDPKISVTPDGRLMVLMGGSVYVDKQLVRRIPQVSFSTDGVHFSDPQPVIFDEMITDEHEWVWRVTWHEGVGYAVVYGEHFALLKTTDGLHFQTICELDVDKEAFPNETTVRFLPDGRMALLVRRERLGAMGMWGVSSAPFTEWTWKEMPVRLGGPDFIVLPDDSIIAGTRGYFFPDRPKAVLLKSDLEGNFELNRVLPSGSDCSYPGFLIVGKKLWVVYYSSHELLRPDGRTRAGIYLAKIPLKELQ